jgi:hypothetical protein
LIEHGQKRIEGVEVQYFFVGQASEILAREIQGANVSENRFFPFKLTQILELDRQAVGAANYGPKFVDPTAAARVEEGAARASKRVLGFECEEGFPPRRVAF